MAGLHVLPLSNVRCNLAGICTLCVQCEHLFWTFAARVRFIRTGCLRSKVPRAGIWSVGIQIFQDSKDCKRRSTLTCCISGTLRSPQSQSLSSGSATGLLCLILLVLLVASSSDLLRCNRVSPMRTAPMSTNSCSTSVPGMRLATIPGLDT